MISHLCADTLSTNHHWRRSQFHQKCARCRKKICRKKRLFYLRIAFDSLVFAPQSHHQDLHHPCHHYQQIQWSSLQSQIAQSHHQINLCNRRYHWKSANQRDSESTHSAEWYSLLIHTKCFPNATILFPPFTSPYFGIWNHVAMNWQKQLMHFLIWKSWPFGFPINSSALVSQLERGQSKQIRGNLVIRRAQVKYVALIAYSRPPVKGRAGLLYS